EARLVNNCLFCGSMPQNSKFLHKRHNVTVLLYHVVSSAKNRRVVITDKVDQVLVTTCSEIEKPYEVSFLEVGTDGDHIHFLIQSVPTYSFTKIVRMVKSLTAREVFQQCSEVKKQFWGKGYYVNTVGRHGSENVIAKYVREQGLE